VAKYRPVLVRIWKDPDFQAYSPELKLIFLYLCTNDATSESGIYPLSLRTVANETDVGLERIKEIFETGAIKNVFYDPENQFVLVKNFRKYNAGGRPTLIEQAISNEYRDFRTSLWDIFKAEYPEFDKVLLKVKVKVKGKEPLPNRLITVKQRLANKKPYGEFKNVLLTDEEYQKLVNKFGSTGTIDRIENMSASIESKGYKYRDHYAAILTWDRKDQKQKVKSPDQRAYEPF
jgi:hypothetical protein